MAQDTDDRGRDGDTPHTGASSRAATLRSGSRSRTITLPSVGSRLVGGRFELRRRVGEGGMGVVYAAFDRERASEVAVKTLSRLEAGEIYRLKNEFRALSEVAHPNLVRLHELFHDEGAWFFTMDLVDGLPFDHWVRPDDRLDETRLRSALPQLVSAVSAIHHAGKLHRDLKPRNVMVGGDGRIVVLDFGLAADPELGGVGQTVDDNMMSGTPAYMAPEQAAGEAMSEASDWYALGVMLFEALTGNLPFVGRSHEILIAKQTREAPSPGDREPGLPGDLVALCASLLARDAGARPHGAGLRARLPLPPARASLLPSRSVAVDAARAIVGREAELAALRKAFSASLHGRSVFVWLSGDSGMGKSALVERFLSTLRAGREATVLSGRCYERESVPFKGFDSLLDDLSRHLRKLSGQDAALLMPRDVFALSRLFPVLERVSAVAASPSRTIPDPQQLRRRAFAAFVELLTRMRDRAPLVVHLDDLQWVDEDSTRLLRYLLVRREPLPVLVIASYRAEGDPGRRTAGEPTNPLLSAIEEAARENAAVDVRALSLGPLPRAAAEQLATELLDARPDSATLARAIAAEAGGNPFFVVELARHAEAQQAFGNTAQTPSFRRALTDRLAALPAGARAMLRLLSLAGRPLSPGLLVAAAGTEDGHVLLDVLREAHLVRGGGGGGRTLECFHDRIREAVRATLDAEERRAGYGRLADALSAGEHADVELLTFWLTEAGRTDEAAHLASRAADGAARALAFARAARLYGQALERRSMSEAERRTLLLKRGDAFANGGLVTEAAAAYREAARGAAGDAMLELKRKATEQLLVGGRMTEGMALARELTRQLDLKLAKSTKAALAGVLVSQVRLRLRGLHLCDKPAAALTARTRQQLETCRSVVSGLVGTSPAIAANLADRYLAIALDAGDPTHALRALAFEAYFVSLADPGAVDRAERLLGLARGLHGRVEEPAARGFFRVMVGAVDAHFGRFAQARSHQEKALSILRNECTGVVWEIDSAMIYDQIGALWHGDFADLSMATPVRVEEALGRGNVLAAVMLGGPGVPARLARGDIGGLRRYLDDVRARWTPQSELQWPDWFIILNETWLHQYRGDPAAALARIESRQDVYKRSLLRRAEIGHILTLFARSGAAVELLQQGGGRARRAQLRATVTRDVRALLRCRSGYARPLAGFLTAALWLSEGQPERAIERLRSAVADADAAAIRMWAGAAKRQLGVQLGGDEGRELFEAGEHALRTQGVVDPEALARMLAPGLAVSGARSS